MLLLCESEIMKKGLLTLYLCGLAVLGAKGDGFVLQNYLGVNCITHDLQPEETFYQVAKRYFVRPSTLAVVNNIDDVANLESGKRLLIPLTETNFYTTKGLGNSKFTFEPIYYKVIKEKNVAEVAAAFYSNPANIAEWNKMSVDNDVDQGDRMIVGWVKYEKELKDKVAPNFIKKEQIVFGNATEREEAKLYLKKKEEEKRLLAKQKELQQAQVNESSKRPPVTAELPFKSVDAEKQEQLEARREAKRKKEGAEKRRKEIEQQRLEEERKQFALAQQKAEEARREAELKRKQEEVARIQKQKRLEKERLDRERKQRLLAEKKAQEAREKAEQKRLKEEAERKKLEEEERRKKEALSKKEEEFLEKNKSAKKSKKKSTLRNKLKNLTKNSYSRGKNKNDETEVKKAVEPVAKTTSKKSTPIVEAKTETKKTVVADTKKTVEKIKSDDPLIIENKMQRLTLLKSTRGRASFFYSGTAGAKFYAFTNLANKGGVIKITNLGNGRYILAEVVGPLPEADRRRGYLIKLSDNSKLILGTKSKSFSAKVNY